MGEAVYDLPFEMEEVDETTQPMISREFIQRLESRTVPTYERLQSGALEWMDDMHAEVLADEDIVEDAATSVPPETFPRVLLSVEQLMSLAQKLPDMRKEITWVLEQRLEVIHGQLQHESEQPSPSQYNRGRLPVGEAHREYARVHGALKSLRHQWS